MIFNNVQYVILKLFVQVFSNETSAGFADLQL